MTAETTTPQDPSQPSRWRLMTVAALVFLAINTATRVALVAFHPNWLTTAPAALLAALAAGALLDVLAAGWVLLPLAGYLTALPERWLASRRQRLLATVGFGVTLFAWLFTAVAEILFFAEFDGRFNFVAVDYLLYPTEVSHNIWESYPTGLILATLLAAAIVGARRLTPAFASDKRPAIGVGARWARLALFAAALALATATLPQLAGFVVRPVEDRALAEVGGNGYLRFWKALLGADAPYEGLYPSMDERLIATRLNRLVGRSAPNLSTLRHVSAAVPGGVGERAGDIPAEHVGIPHDSRPTNVVIVLEESLGAELVGSLHPRPVSLTPELDALTQRGTLLTQAYSTGNRTIRAIEATTTSLPPLPGSSIVRRPASVGLFTLPAVLAARGYQTTFIYGGRALFDGMNPYLSNNGIERIVDLDDFPPDVFTTAWGAADEHVFDRTLVEMEEMRQRGQPFYSLVLTVSNHRPFTFPEDVLERDPKLNGRENAVRYADYALGRFMRQALARGFDRDTLFVLMGDHGARVYGAAEIPLGSYEVPILFLGSGIEAGRRIDTLASSLDVPPTVLARLGVAYDSRFFGQDVFTVPAEAGRALVTHNNQVALLRGGRLAILGLHGRAEVFAYQRGGAAFETILRPNQAERDLVADAIAYFAGADKLYRNGGYQITAAEARLAQRTTDAARLSPRIRATPDAVRPSG